MATQTYSKKGINKKRILRVALYTLILGGAVGTVTGTYAWYSYQKSASIDFTGTAISNTELIQIGLRADHRLNTPDDVRSELGNMNFEQFYHSDISLGQIVGEEITLNQESNYIYWIKGNYLQEILKNFAYSIGSGVDKLPAVTTGYFEEGMEWDLGNRSAVEKWNGFKKTPINEQRDFKEFASLKDYYYLPLAFRVYGGAEYKEALPNRKIYLTKFDSTDITAVTSQTQRSLKKAIRCKADYPEVVDHSKDFVFDPNSNQSYELKVGGGLNIDYDIYEDYDQTENGVYEKAYGQFDGDPQYVGPCQDDPVIPYNNCTTFEANHKKGAYMVSDANARTCQTRSNSIVNPYQSGDAIITTNADAIGFLDLSIYLEGWDHGVIDQNLNHTFAVSLEFSIE